MVDFEIVFELVRADVAFGEVVAGRLLEVANALGGLVGFSSGFRECALLRGLAGVLDEWLVYFLGGFWVMAGWTLCAPINCQNSRLKILKGLKEENEL